MNSQDFTHKNATEYGIDISKSRFDDIDRAVTEFALGYKGKKVAVDIGCGSGRVSIVLALMGFDVWLYDIQDLDKYFIKVGEALDISDKLHFIQTDLALGTRAGEEGLPDLPNDIVITISQRTLHHLPHLYAKGLLKRVGDNMIDNGKLFLSVSGIESKLADDYGCSDSPVIDRFCKVGEVGKSIYSIGSNVCLYKQNEVVDMVEEGGFTIDKIYKSAFGNIKAICSKRV